MKKNIQIIVAILLTVGFSFTSCSKESSITQTNKGYNISINANKASTKAVAFDGTNGVSTFNTEENVYVYNESTAEIDAGVLHPSSNAAHTTFSGALSGTYSVGNTLKVLYNTTSAGVADYTTQDGTIEHVTDAGVGSVSISSISGEGTISTSDANITNLQSIFKLTFKYGVTTLDNVKSVVITSGGNKLQSKYDVVSDTPTYGPVVASNSTAQSTFYVALRFTTTANDPITFQVVTADGKVYTGTKNAPAEGFVNGNLYKATVDNLVLASFSVADGKVVYFSPGNLGKKSSVFYFIDLFSEWFVASTGIWSYEGTSPRSYFTYRELVSGLPYESDNPLPFTVYGIENWRVLKWTEWKYLIWERTMLHEAEGVARFYEINDKSSRYSLLIPPDNATSTDVAGLTAGSITSNVDYNEYVKKGFVLLPSHGYTNGKTITRTYGGQYLSVTFNTTVKTLRFSTYYHVQEVDADIAKGYSVRLVHE